MTKNNLVVLYKNTNKYTVVVDVKDKLKNLNKGKFYDEETQKWVIGEIVFRGTEQMCKKYTNYSLEKFNYIPTDDEFDQFEPIENETIQKAKRCNY